MNPLFKITEIFPFSIISNDLAHPWQIGFQDGASPGFSGIIELHDTIFFYLVVIAIGVFWLLGSVIYSYKGEQSNIVHKYLNHGTIECLSNCLEFYKQTNKNSLEEMRRLVIFFSYRTRRHIFEPEGLKIKPKQIKFIFCSKFEKLKPFISIQIRQYSNETLLYSITPEANEKKLEQPISEIDQSLNYLNPVKSYEDAYAFKT
jgi:cytochrome c oxidase subunit II-like protein